MMQLRRSLSKEILLGFMAVEGGRNQRFVVYAITLEIEWSDSGWCWCSMQKNKNGEESKII